MMSELRTRCCVVLDTSTSGDSPVTVIVSSSEPTRSSLSTVTAADPLTATPSRLTVLNPASEKVTV